MCSMMEKTSQFDISGLYHDQNSLYFLYYISTFTQYWKLILTKYYQKIPWNSQTTHTLSNLKNAGRLADTIPGNHYITFLIWSQIKKVRKKFMANILLYSKIKDHVFKIHPQVYFPFRSSEIGVARYFTEIRVQWNLTTPWEFSHMHTFRVFRKFINKLLLERVFICISD